MSYVGWVGGGDFYRESGYSRRWGRWKLFRFSIVYFYEEGFGRGRGRGFWKLLGF